MAEQVQFPVFCLRAMAITAALSSLLPSMSQSARGEQLLRWKLAAGTSLRYQFQQGTQSETAGAGKAMRVSVETVMTVTWKVESVDAQQVATLTQTIDSFGVTIKTDKLDPIVYDSTSKTPPVGPARDIAGGLTRLLGAPCTIEMSNRGEIVAVKPSEQFQLALAPAPGNAPATQAGGLLTLEGMTQALRQAVVTLPEKPVSDGTKWEVKQKSSAPTSSVLLESQFTYAGVAERDGVMLDKITVESSFTHDPNSAGTARAIQIKEGSQTGNLWFDSSAGRMVAGELTQRLVTERPYRDLTIRVQSTSTVGMKLLK